MVKKLIFTFLLISIGLVFFICDTKTSKKEAIILDSIKAESVELQDPISFFKDIHGTITETAIVHNSDIEGLTVCELYKRNLTSNLSSILIKWKDTEYILTVDGDLYYLRMRPRHPSFIYSKAEESDQSADYTRCSLHYVEINYVNGEIILDEYQLSQDQVSTDLAWSSDGIYYVYSENWKLHIKNFQTNQEWVAEKIIINDKEKTGNTDIIPFHLGGFKWINNNSKIYVEWKRHLFDDESFAMEIDVKQFNLK